MVRGDMGNRDGLRRLWGGGFFGGGRCWRRGGGEFGLELADDALQFRELFGVFFGEVSELFAKFSLPVIKGNEENRRGHEQQQSIEHYQ
jgi:hypothetical protein